VEATGGRAAIGALQDAVAVLDGERGTTVTARVEAASAP
jgi:carbamate kinase